MKTTLWIASITLRELFYERLVHLLLSFATASLGVSLLLGQMTYIEQGKLTLDFMLAAIQISLVLFAVFMGISLFHREFQTGSIAMVLAKPISRTSFLVGKYLGQVAAQGIIIAGMTVVALVISKQMGVATPSEAIIQACLCTYLEVACLSAISLFFSVNAGPITASIGTLSLFLLGHLRELITKSLRTHSELSWWKFLSSLIPDLGAFNLKTLASYGVLLPWHEIAWLGLYAMCCLVFFLALAALCFSRKDILT